MSELRSSCSTRRLSSGFVFSKKHRWPDASEEVVDDEVFPRPRGSAAILAQFRCMVGRQACVQRGLLLELLGLLGLAKSGYDLEFGDF